MRLFFLIYFIFFANVCIGLENACSCYNFSNTMEIYGWLGKFKHIAEEKFLWEMPQYGGKWEIPYRSEFKTHLSLYPNSSSMRYPDVYQTILLYEDRVNFLGNFWIRKWNEYCLGEDPLFWGNSKEEREIMFNDQKDQFLHKISFCQKFLLETHNKIANKYIDIYENCLAKNHNNLIALHDYGLFFYLNNNFDKSFELLSKLIDQAEKCNSLDNLNSEVYHNLGSVSFEAMKYDQSIEYLTTAIQKDPNNKTLYFDRALAYFETGDFNSSVKDYIDSNYAKNVLDAANESQSLWERYKKIDTSFEFKSALLEGLLQGTAESTAEFFPSLLHSVYGLSQALWVGVKELDIESTYESIQCFSNACYEMAGECVQFCKDVNWKDIKNCTEEIKILYSKFDSLNDHEKGMLIGHSIGKYGVDIFAGGATLKGLAILKNVKNANRICNLEAMATSKTTQKIINATTLKRFADRETFLEKVVLNVDKQNKHIVGAHNFKKGASILEHGDPKKLLDTFKGTGTPVRKENFSAGYAEVVDFKEYIGKWVGKDGEILPTTRGTIHYSKKDAHIVPAHPKGTIYE